MGETRRFIDEIEYLLDGLIGTGSNETIRSSIEEIVKKCYSTGTDGEFIVNSGFGMKLKSHGALEKIFESLNDTNDPVVLNYLVLLISALLYDVRRLDFFFKPELAIKIAKHCIKTDSVLTCEVIEMLKSSQVLNKSSCENPFTYFAIWLLSKWAFSRNAEFFNLLSSDQNLIKILVETCENQDEIGEKSSDLLDFLLNRKLIKIEEKDTLYLLQKLLVKTSKVSFMKLAVSLTASAIKFESSDVFFHLIKSIMKITFPLNGEEVEILSLSCLINLIDRSEDTLMDEFRYIQDEAVESDIKSDGEIINNLNNDSSVKISVRHSDSSACSVNNKSLLQLLAFEYCK